MTVPTQQPADFLRISRPTLIKLLDTGKVPYERLNARPLAAGRALREIATRRGRRTPHQLVDHLEPKYGMTDAAAILREHLD